jgi:purine-nucleoside phosphorylase
MLRSTDETVKFIQKSITQTPKIGIILGSGLGELVSEMAVEKAMSYEEIPHFPVSTVKGHQGRLIFGTLNGVRVVALQGRFHFYEGYRMDEVVFPVRVLKMLGIQYLFVSNAAGGVNPAFDVGDIMLITDHINLMPNPLVGPNETGYGPRFVDMSEAYNKKLLGKAQKVARHNSIHVKHGVYAAVTGPTYETPAEYRYIRILGADAVGMSTVPEVIVARHMRLPVFAVSVISDLGVEGKIVEISHDEVVDAAALAAPRLNTIIKGLVREV